MEIFLSIVGGISQLLFTVSVPAFVLSLLNLIIAGGVGLATKDYKYFKLYLKIVAWIVVAVIFAVLMFAIKMFLEKAILGA